MKVRLNGIGIEIADDGRKDAPVVVLHHPLATAISYWDEVAAALAPTYRVVRFDARGHGRSDAPASGPYDFATLTADVIALLDHLTLPKVAFVGLSMGGMIGQYLALAAPERLTSLTLVATSSRTPKEADPLWRQRIADVAERGMSSQIDVSLDRWITPASRATRPELVARLTRLIEATPPAGFIGWAEAIRRRDVTDRLGEIRLPTLVVAGALDSSTTVPMHETIHRGIPGSELVVMPDVAHMLSVEAPDAFLAHLMPFLARHAAA